MAHYEKFSRQGLGHIFAHVRRAYTIENGEKRYVKFSNHEIDESRSHLNYNLCVNEQGTPRNQQRRYEAILQNETLPEGYSLIMNKRKDLRVLCSWCVTIPDDVREGDERKFFEAVYKHLKCEYPHDVSAWVHNDELGHSHIHYLFVPVYYDEKKDVYRVSANDLVDRAALNSFHDKLSKAVESELGYKTSIMTGESSLRREQGLRGSIDMLKFKAQKMAEEYIKLKEKFKGEGLKLSADMASYIVESGQKEQFINYQVQKEIAEQEVEYGRER